ncbi:acyl-CoA dehydratase activase [Cetobacterium somerae]|uniref:acyl-CoA dehydratase activase n=1 Tax=Cetobacterium sp. NK01 TaxID=2993530 RepID=UPI002115FB31|nr:acyl-CoA dehydratase activase [Cetobacterium sp. NK01]MCQ8213522.1 acyl-CoA dehydratase activase [Cetobacterium sp. NK01]
MCIRIGIDIGSTATKIAIFKGDILEKVFSVPSGWSSVETSEKIKSDLENEGYNFEECKVTATGYGRISVPYANKTVTEITCHSKGAQYITQKKNFTVIDIGGQDTKIIEVFSGNVENFIMNDKCSAGTGRFIEVMANILGVKLNELYELASQGKKVEISSMCTVFAESEVISLMGRGTAKEDIACGIVDSVVNKVAGLASRSKLAEEYFLSGGLCSSSYFIEELSKKLGTKISTDDLGRFAGAIGAALMQKI